MWQLHQLPQTQKEGEIMKKLLFAIIAMASFALSAGAQKFALVDMEYILNHIPAYSVFIVHRYAHWRVSLLAMEQC